MYCGPIFTLCFSGLLHVGARSVAQQCLPRYEGLHICLSGRSSSFLSLLHTSMTEAGPYEGEATQTEALPLT